MEQILYTIKEVSELLHTNIQFVYSLVNSGVLPAIKLKSLRVRKIALDEFLAKYEGYNLSDIKNISKIDFSN